jgi:diguanylate cyclase (GGDEF)-like protein
MTAATSSSRQTRLRRAIIVFAASALAGLVAYSVHTWNREKQEVNDNLAILSGYLATAAQSWFDNLGNGLEPLGELAVRNDVLRNPEGMRDILVRFQNRYPGVGAMSVITPDGKMLVNTVTAPGERLPHFGDDPPYLEKLQAALAQPRSYVIGPPEFGKVIKEWRFPFRHVVRDASGAPSFVIQAAVPLGARSTFLQSLPLPPQSYVGLLREDGFQQARWPVADPKEIYQKPLRGPLYRQLQQNPTQRTGVFAGESLWTGDERQRIGAFQHLERDPLIAYVSVPASYVWAHWWRHNAAVVLAFLLFISVTSVLALRIAERERVHRRELLFRARHDSLTELPNRAAILEILASEQAVSQATRRSFAVLFMDIDRFKDINDSLGHLKGDELLKSVAKRVQAQLRASDILARLGGDEFLIVSRGADEHGATVTAERILDAFRTPVTLDDQQALVTPSIGMAIYPAHGNDAATLVKHADTAMYESKKRGRNTATLYAGHMGESVQNRLRAEQDLRRALQHNELRLYFQPIVELATGQTVGAEALLRWQRAGVGLCSPADFIGIAEESGLILPIGEWVLDAACAQLRRWSDQGQPWWVSLNLSARQFQDPRLVHKVRAAIERTGIAPRQLEIEVTETVAMLHPETAVATFSQLQAMDIRITIDDFGTGYSSLSYLKRIPAGKIKIDRSFINGYNRNPDDTAIVRTIVALAQSLERQTVAEGIETAEQYAAVQQLGCTQAQGFWINSPVPAEEFAVGADRPAVKSGVTAR